MWFSSGKIKRLIQTIAIGTACLIFSAAADAQVPTSGNVFFGYSFENAGSSSFDLSNLGRPNLNGWEASLEGRVLPWVGLVADFGGRYGSQSYQTSLPPDGVTGTINVNGQELTVLFGPRVSVSLGKFRPFAEALFGAAHIKTTSTSSEVLVDNFVQPRDTSFATAVGGGLDYKIIRPVAWRFQGDYVQTRFFGATQNNVRISTGIVFRF
jgi:opacity protein-like surface antigen